jgi:hypothetical protein
MSSLLEESEPAGLAEKPDVKALQANQVPLCVDFDGTQTDLLVEGMTAIPTNKRQIGKWPQMLATAAASIGVPLSLFGSAP